MPLRLAPLRALARYARYDWVRHDLHHEWRRRLGGEPELPSRPLRRVLVICHGNICRSPFAEAILARLAPELELTSAGLEAGTGNLAEPGALRMAPRFGLSLDAHRSRPLDADLAGWCDLILGMEGRHAVAVARRFAFARAKTRLLGDFLPSAPFRIADPWGQPDESFERTFERIALASEQLVARLRSRGGHFESESFRYRDS